MQCLFTEGEGEGALQVEARARHSTRAPTCSYKARRHTYVCVRVCRLARASGERRERAK